MAATIVSDPVRVLEFYRRFHPLAAVEGMKGLGLERGGELTAGVVYEGYNGHNIWMHVAAQPGGKWLDRQFLTACFLYPFVQLGVKRVSGYVEARNTAARRFDEHLGFKQEAVLEGAASDGGDVLIYVMRREECRYVPIPHH
jgi:RimJ/RimL family protein N-acetyltransferase